MVGWFQTIASIERAWVFGSRARNCARADSDLDVAVSLDPRDGKVLAEWIFKSRKWRGELQAAVGNDPTVDLQLAHPEYDEVVWPAVQAHGIKIYDKNG